LHQSEKTHKTGCGNLRPVHPLGTSVNAFAPTKIAALVACFSSLLVGCESESAPAKTAEAPVPVAAEQAAADPDAPRFDVRVEAPEHAPPGKETLAKVRVEPRKPWHMNTDFPVALRIEATNGVTLEVPRQRKDDAERFDGDGLVFALPFTPTTDGPKHIEGEIDFAVCGDAACAPETVPVDFTVDVGCDSGALC